MTDATTIKMGWASPLTADLIDQIDGEGVKKPMTDILADLIRLADGYDIDFDQLLGQARRYTYLEDGE